MTLLRVTIPGGRFAHFLGGAAVASVLGGTAFAVSSASFTYSAPQTAHYQVGTLGFAPADEGSYPIVRAGSVVVEAGCATKGVSLPEGAIMKNIAVQYERPGAGSLGFSFVRTQPANGTYVEIAAAINPPAAPDTHQSITLPIPANMAKVFNGRFSYGVMLCGAHDVTYYGARILFTYTSAGA